MHARCDDILVLSKASSKHVMCLTLEAAVVSWHGPSNGVATDLFHLLLLCLQISMLTYLSSYLAMASAFYYVIFEGVAVLQQHESQTCGMWELVGAAAYHPSCGSPKQHRKSRQGISYAAGLGHPVLLTEAMGSLTVCTTLMGSLAVLFAGVMSVIDPKFHDYFIPHSFDVSEAVRCRPLTKWLCCAWSGMPRWLARHIGATRAISH